MPSAILRSKVGRRFLDLGGAAAGDRTGALVEMCDNEPARATYGAFIAGFVPAATPTDVFRLRGSATKLVRLKSLYISGTATSASNVLLFLALRTVLNTGGTTNNVTPGRHDSTDDAVAAVVETYTANPSALGAGATIAGGRLNLAPAANGSIDRLALDWAWRSDKAPVLNGANESLCLNVNGAAWPAGGALDIQIVWTEEAIETVL